MVFMIFSFYIKNMIIRNWMKCYTMEEALDIAYKQTVEDADEFVKALFWETKNI